MKRRVVITGMGTLNPLGVNVAQYWEALLAGRHGIGIIKQFDHSLFKVHFAGEVPGYDPEKFLDPPQPRRLDRFAQFGVLSAREAIRDSGLDFGKEDPFRCGVAIGTGIGGLNELEEQKAKNVLDGSPARISIFCIPKMIPNSAAGVVSMEHKLAGPNTVVSTACASANQAIGEAMRMIQLDLADVMVTGASESAITPLGLGGFSQMKALSTRNDNPGAASRPFDRDRDGFVLSEGGGVVVLEELEHARRRGANIYAELLGSASTADAHHLTEPHPEGLGAAKAIELALRDARVDPSEVGYVNAHGTSTPKGDAAETMAIKRVLGPHAAKVLVSSTKSMTGHLLGASGAIELIATALSLKHGIIHPTINLDNPDPRCDLDYVPKQAREARVKRAISNSFGFGGHNCCLVIGSYS